MRNSFFIIVLIMVVFSCSSSHLVDQYSNPDIKEFKPKKILVIGLTPDGGLQRQFEYSMVKALEREHIIAVKSVDLFKTSLQITDNLHDNWKTIESELIADNYNAILLSKITGQENRVTVAQSYRNLMRTIETFDDYYKMNQNVSEGQELEDFSVLNTETSLYCLCPQREDDLVWRGNIDIINAKNPEKTISDYIKVLMKSFKKSFY